MTKTFTVRLTRDELVTVESMLRHLAEDGGDEYFKGVADGFNEAIGDDAEWIKPIEPITAAAAKHLAERLCCIEAIG